MAAAPECPIPHQPALSSRMQTTAAPAMTAAPITCPSPVDGATLTVIEQSDAPTPATTPPSNLYNEALALFDRGRLAETEEKITALLALPGSHAAALALLARIRANAGKLADASDLCEKAIAGDKLNPGYQYLRATIQQELGLIDESIASLKRALYLDQNFVLAHFSLGNLALRQGKGREAGRHFENALSALKTLGRDDILPESEGVTAGRMEEIIRATTEEVMAA